MILRGGLSLQLDSGTSALGATVAFHLLPQSGAYRPSIEQSGKRRSGSITAVPDFTLICRFSPLAKFFRQFLSESRNLRYTCGFAVEEAQCHASRSPSVRPPMRTSAPAASSLASSAGSRSAPSPRRKPSASAGCSRSFASSSSAATPIPPTTTRFLQIARLERALDLIGGQIDAGKPAAVHAFVRILDHLNRLAPDRLRLRAMGLRFGDEVDQMAERLDRLDAARETLALREAEGGREGAKTRRNQIAPKPLKTKEPAKRPISRPQRFQRLRRAQAKGFVSPAKSRPPYPPRAPSRSRSPWRSPSARGGRL